MRRRLRALNSAFAVLAMFAVLACGDRESRDNRGYTKAPLEDPGLTIEGEVPTTMDELGDPAVPTIREIPVDSVAAPSTAS